MRGKVIHQHPSQSRLPKPLGYLRRKRASDRSGIRGIVKAVGRRTTLPMSESTIGDTDFCEKKPKHKTSFRCVCQAKKERKAKKNPQNHLFLRIFGAGKTFGKPKADLNLHEIAFIRTWWLRHLGGKSNCPYCFVCGGKPKSCDLPILRLEKRVKKWYNKFGKHIFADCSLCHAAKKRRTRFLDEE